MCVLIGIIIATSYHLCDLTPPSHINFVNYQKEKKLSEN